MTTESTAPQAAEPKRDAYQIDLSQADSQPFPHHDFEYRIILEKNAHDDILAHAATNPNIELCGVLVGNLHQDEAGPYLHITDIVRGKEAREEASNVTFTHSTWEHIHKEMDAKHADSRIVGWYHMHPGFGVFLSEVDIFAHTHFFNAAWQVALVVDPKAQSEGFFHWRNGEVVRSRRYWIGSETRWIPAVRPATSIPPGTGTTNAGPKPRGQQLPVKSANATSAGDDRGGWWDMLTLGLPILLCLLLFFLNFRTSMTNSQLAAEIRRLEHEAATNNRQLASDTAKWLRTRLDSGASVDSLRSIYAEMLKLDPDREQFYSKLLPEFESGTKLNKSKSKAKKKSASGKTQKTSEGQ
ncbi:MAG: hypothetical protein Tsb009_25780 [Planctomycetaceae bacterium]